jgi:sugar lactone lactonase YvrE
MNTLRTASLLLLGLALTACPNAPTRPCVPSAGTICTIAGTEIAGIDGDGGPGWDARLYLPMDAELGPDGNLYIVDWNNHRLRRMTLDGTLDGTIDTFAGNGVLGDGPDGGPMLGAAFNHPTNIAFGPDGNLYIAAWHNSRIRRCNMSTGNIELVAGTGARAYGGDGGPALTALLDLPSALAFDPDGNIVFVDQANQVLRRIDMTTGTIERIGGTCITTAPCEAGETPVACPGTNKSACTTMDPAGCSLPCAQAYGGDDGPALEARFAFPFGQAADPSGRLAIDADGNIYFADSRNHRIRMISPDGMIVTIAGTGSRTGDPGEGVPATMANLDNPVDVDIGPDGSLYVADTMNDCIRRIDAAGIIHTAAGVCGDRGFDGDGGPPTEAHLDRPYGIEVADDGTLYVADTHNHRIRVVRPAD